MKLNKLIEIFLATNDGIFTYGELATEFGTSARGVGSAMKAIGKRNMQLTERVVMKGEK